MIPETQMDTNENDSTAFERNVATYKNNSSRFVLRGRSFERQYFSFYRARLRLLKSKLTDLSIERWGKDVPVKELCDISTDEHVIVIGTLFKAMELHPSILRDISEEHHLIPQAVTDEYTKDDDFLVLEDDLQRIVLCGNIDPHTHVTGIIVAVRGYEEENGKFNVNDVCYRQASMPPEITTVPKNQYVMIVSGLGVGRADVQLPLQLLLDYLIGLSGDEQQQTKVSQIVRLIIAGNSICEKSKDSDALSKAHFLSKKAKPANVEFVKILDDVLAQLAASIEVDIMPGEFDPANHLMPQQPLHPCMFPKASKYSSIHYVTNPYDSLICGLRFLGTSGQNISDIMAYSRLKDPIEIMQKTLQWGHLLPTAPDTLNSYPFNDEDPFIITDCPNVLFAGNMPKMQYKRYGSKDSRVITLSVPKFQESFTAVLINLRTLAVEPFVFSEV